MWREVALLCSAAAAIACTLVLGYIYPPSDPTDDADVVFVLGLATPERLAVARKIAAQQGGVPIYVSDPRSREWVCNQRDLICLVPDPATTKGEAAIFREVATVEGFHHAAVLTFGPHLTRARYIFHRCYGTDVDVVRVDEPLSLAVLVHQVGYQTLGMAKALATPCSDTDGPLRD